jgi:hypothetical protein
MERHDRRELERPNEVEHGLAVLATPDAGLELDRDDIRAAFERTGRSGVVGSLVTPDPVMDLERIRRNRLQGMQRDDLAVGRDAAQVTSEGGDPASARRIAGDERGANDVGLRSGEKKRAARQ